MIIKPPDEEASSFALLRRRLNERHFAKLWRRIGMKRTSSQFISLLPPRRNFFAQMHANYLSSPPPNWLLFHCSLGGQSAHHDDCLALAPVQPLRVDIKTGTAVCGGRETENDGGNGRLDRKAGARRLAHCVSRARFCSRRPGNQATLAATKSRLMKE